MIQTSTMVQAVLPMLVAVLLGMFAVVQSQSSGLCYLQGVAYENGTIKWTPGDAFCERRICDNGSFVPYYKGCELDNYCVFLGYIFTRNCITYECSRVMLYNIIEHVLYITRTRCQDTSGACHENGTQGLSVLDDNFEVAVGCTCLVRGQGDADYDCP